MGINETETYNFGQTIAFLNGGKAMARLGWNGEKMFIVKQIPQTIAGIAITAINSLPESAKNLLRDRNIPYLKYNNQILIINKDGEVNAWLPSSSDIFANDWFIVNE